MNAVALGLSDMDIKTSHTEWVTWLAAERHISLDIATKAGLTPYNNELSIPIRDMDGNLLFYKHRRSFKTSNGMKYRYDKGATAALFGIETLKDLPEKSTVIVTEGELDALAMRTLGYSAVSSTGGAGTWNDSWSALLALFDVVILYDADNAGINGTLRVASRTPNARIAWTPVEFGKDPTDVIRSGHTSELVRAVIDSERYYVPEQDTPKRLEALRRIQAKLLTERGILLAHPLKTPFHIDIALAWIESEINRERATEKKAVFQRDGTDLQRARSYPIKNLIKINSQHKAKCLWHDDKEPSMHVYADNHTYCFVCQKRADVIDVYMVLNNCDFKTAMTALI